jgi:hypothetical protein
MKYLTMDMGAVARRPPDGKIHHLLHLYYHWFLPSEDWRKEENDDDAFLKEWTSKLAEECVVCLLPPALELEDVGMKLRSKPSSRSLVDMVVATRRKFQRTLAIKGGWKFFEA